MQWYFVLDSSEYFSFSPAPNPKYLIASLHAAQFFLINLQSPRLSRFNPTIYFVGCHIALLTCQLSSPYVQMHDSISHPYIHFFNFVLILLCHFIWHVILTLQVLRLKFCMYFVTLYALHVVPISVLVILFFKYLVRSYVAIFIVGFSLTFNYIGSTVTKYVTQLLTQPRSFYLHKWNANMAVYCKYMYMYIFWCFFWPCIVV